MHPSVRKAFITFGISAFILLGGMGSDCTDESSTTTASAQASCATGIVQIGILDGMLQRLCGCTLAGEENGTYVLPGTQLSCTPSANPAKVFFVFMNQALRSQIVPVGTNTFPPSQVYVPQEKPVMKTHFVQMSGASGATFDFKDQFNSTITGQITLP